MSDWTFLTDHAHVLVLLARDPRATVPDLAAAAGLPAPEVGAIIRDLEAAGYVRRSDQKGTTFTVIDRSRPLRHRVERHHPVGRLLDAVESPGDVLRERLGAPG